ncbi:MAG: homocysteine S-methyltransferase family protein [Acidobacteria bacterium]|nr:homocysteine S-methyltransferase family protein [Acidobacteriota bacterium]
MDDIRERLARGEVILGDGAWGTLLMERGLRAGEPPELFNLDRPDVIEAIAALYLEAGAEIITTNTFGGSPLKLESFALADRAEEINVQAVAAVRRAVGDRAYVSASMGPTGRLRLPFGNTDPAQMAAAFERQAAALAGAGVDLFCVETMTDLDEATMAVAAIRAAAPRVPILATMTFEKTRRGFFTVMGVSIPAAANGLQAAGADIVGSNCGFGIETMVEIARAFKQHAGVPIAIQANAGLPVISHGATVYPETPDEVASRASELLAAGVQIIGGCCGTTPAHIRALRAVINR